MSSFFDDLHGAMGEQMEVKISTITRDISIDRILDKKTDNTQQITRIN